MAARHHPRAAVVVGIDRYLDPAITDLKGAVADARAMASLLTDRFGFAPEALTLLLDDDATSDAIEGALTALAERVAPGGVAFFFFAGHGAQRLDTSGDEADGWDETLVPCDSGRDGRRERDITDDRLRAHLERLCARAATTIACLDCCHAGTGARGEGVRAAPPVVGACTGRRAAMRALAGEPAYVFIGAAAADERAHERPPAPGLAPRGLLTHALVDALRAAGPDDTWQTVMTRVAAKVTAVEPRQRPQLEGAARDRRLFAAEAPRPWAPALSTDAAVRVALGSLHGVEVGGRIALCPLDAEAPRWLAPVMTVGPLACLTGPAPVAELAGSAAAPRPLRARLVEVRRGLWERSLDDSTLAVHFDVDALVDEAGRAQVADGEHFTVRVVNPGGRRLYLGLIGLDDDDRPTVLLPEPGVELALAPFGAHTEAFEASLPPGAAMARHRLVLVATTLPVDLRPLTADARALDVPPVEDVTCALRRLEVWITARLPEVPS